MFDVIQFGNLYTKMYSINFDKDSSGKEESRLYFMPNFRITKIKISFIFM